jgi:uncharacterized protein (DUF924 family)
VTRLFDQRRLAEEIVDFWFAPKSRPFWFRRSVLLHDQLSRNLHRASPRAYAQGERARAVANEAIRRRFDMIASTEARPFFYLPFMHSEDLRDQERSVALYTARLPAASNLWYARHHRAIIRRFGRFPHRNSVLGRASTPEEVAFLRQGGFGG